MKVAFWNGIRESDSVANYVAVIGVMLAIDCKCNVVLSSNYISNQMMQDCFSRRILEEGLAHTPYCFLYGSPEYHGMLWRMKRNRLNNILEMPMSSLTIIYPPDVAEQSMFYYKTPDDTFYMLDMAKCSIAESKNVLDEADLIVVFFSQNKTDIHNFFERFSSLISKAIFIFVNYQRDSGYSSQRLKEDYGIYSNNIGIITENRDFLRACEEGNLGRFVSDSMHRIGEEQNHTFITCIKKIVKKIQEQGKRINAKEKDDE